MTLLVVDPGVKLWGSERSLLATLDALAHTHGKLVLLVPTDAEMIARVTNPAIAIIHFDFGFLNRSTRLKRAWFMLTLGRICIKNSIDKLYLNQAGLSRLVAPVTRLLNIELFNHVRLSEDVPRAGALRGRKKSPVTLIFNSYAMRNLCPGSDQFARYTRRIAVYNHYKLDPIFANTALTPKVSDTFLCAGRLEKRKGQENLIRAVSILRSRKKDFPVVLVGVDTCGGRYEAELRELTVDYGVADLVDFRGYSHAIKTEFAKARFAPIPSHYEPLGRVVLEAWDCGAVPIVSASSGGAAEIVAAAGGGLLYEPDTVESLANAMERAVAMNESDRLAMVARGRYWISEMLSIESYTARLSDSLFNPISHLGRR
ncbi:glycosyltransferase family 4 protein [Sphingomonas sp. AR_OL41]|uniref:glycosyltransferase family 4 protein n=1 Tax=Sphingomonas sp. AR_OL41 TaxID=3042729 RepID=UPI0024815028|nr:glycosyltransferase family 4 protein [Sphingomonas sp. AR_OL41]MDH7972902.1 glycosyltransferase family 4 protein [Sphingomonas sp. AR_OL41]